ncbi:MAG: hypothetical protein K8R58_06895 [Bacteroidales bacterium]|nr:hypothetical protein [Bacteroidales bacterium]
MLSEWEEYWGQLYKRINKEIGSTKHLDKSKEKSWRQFQIFSEGYSDAGDIIKFAWALDDLTLYSIAVITMMNIFNAEICYNEYCEYEFENGVWESVCVNDKDNDIPIFYIKKL